MLITMRCRTRCLEAMLYREYKVLRCPVTPQLCLGEHVRVSASDLEHLPTVPSIEHLQALGTVEKFPYVQLYLQEKTLSHVPRGVMSLMHKPAQVTNRINNAAQECQNVERSSLKLPGSLSM